MGPPVGYLSSTVVAAPVEYELSGSYEMLAKGSGQFAAVQRMKAFVAERTPPGETPRLNEALIKEYRKLHGDKEDQMQPKGAREIKIWVRDNAWCIHTRGAASAPAVGWEHGSVDGKEFQMSLLTDGGGAQGWAFHRPWGAPHSLADEGVPMLWMMTASAGYFETLTNSLIWPAHMKISQSSDKEQKQDFRQPGAWKLRESKPRLPSVITFHGGPQQLTNATYEVTGLTNVGKLLLPTGFIWENLGMPSRVNSAWVPNVRERMVVRFTNFSAVCTRKDLHPRVHPNMSVVDYRVQQPAEYANTNRMKGYVLSAEQKWPTKNTAQAKVDGRSQWREWLWAAALVAVAGLGGAVWWLRRKGRSTAPPSEPDEPTSSV